VRTRTISFIKGESILFCRGLALAIVTRTVGLDSIAANQFRVLLSGGLR
jgi:hypothetical protein